ncbi:ribosomal RNA small subunit methyltransferase A [Candidatus Bathyarchaeota archaeon]|nr:ribosomal RNA small subunit methyltransferase A [Candidatus Bathyarchaeota archaeon]
MSLLDETKYLLRRYRIFPKKRLGQHFMINASLFQFMAELATLTRKDISLDIGAGLGFLTRFLAERCQKVLAVEVDSKLVKVLRERLKDLSNVEIIEGDIFKVRIPAFDKVVSIPSYHASSMLMQWLFNKNFNCAVLVFQKEFANRLVAPIGSKDYGWLSVLVYYSFEVELFDDVPKWMFYPQPKVDSIIVRLKPRKPPPFHIKDKALFMHFVQRLCTQRNRKVRNAVKTFIKTYSAAAKIINSADTLPFHDRRVRELAPEDFGELANALAN